MKAKPIHESDRLRTFAVVLEIGDEVSLSLQTFAKRECLSAAQVTAIKATVTFWV
jgi:predicted DNA-binding protein with PD1-like motif